MANEPPYSLSRAALREKYGSRTINARTKYSERDTTPSAREAREMSKGATKEEAAQVAAEKFASNFGPTQQIQPVAPQFSRRAIQTRTPQFAGGFASPDDVRSAVVAGAQGQLQTPYGSVTLPKPIGLIPPAGSVENLGEFMPSSVGPLSSFALPKPTLLSSGSRWSRPAFG
jgi:hypothetical protein